MNRDRLRQLRNNVAWYRIRNAAGDGGVPAEVAIYDEIGWFGTSAAEFMDELKAITASAINLHINSPGGEIFDGIAIMNVLRSHPANVTVIVDSLAASIASVIAMAGDTIIMQPHSQMMIHDGAGLCVGNAADMIDMAALLSRQSDNIAAVYNERAGGGVKSWRARMQTETWYTAQEAVDAGLADRVGTTALTTATEPLAPAARWDLSVFNFPGREAAPTPDLGARRGTPVAAATDIPAPTDVVDATCPNCGATVPDGATECPECGQAMPAGNDAGPEATDMFAGVDLDSLPAWDPKRLHTALFDAADDVDLGVDTTPLRLHLDGDWTFDPDALRATLLDAYQHQPAPPPKPTPPAPSHVSIDEFTEAMRKGLTS